MEDHIALISVGPSADRFHYVINNTAMDTKTAMMHLINSGMNADTAEDYLATLPERWFHDMDAFLSNSKPTLSRESALAQ